MTLRTLDSLGDLTGMRVFLRVDMNVPLHDGNVADDSRIRASVPTIEELLERGATLVVASHLGRPKGEVRDELRLARAWLHQGDDFRQRVAHDWTLANEWRTDDRRSSRGRAPE